MSTLEKQIIVIVDDDAEDVYLLQHVIAQNYPHLETVVITDSEQVHHQLDQLSAPPLIMLLDLHMPLKHGLDVLADLRNHPVHRRLPVAILTGMEDSLLTHSISGLDVIAYLTKPVNYLETSLLLKELLARLDQKT